jgi:hypothetical protein
MNQQPEIWIIVRRIDDDNFIVTTAERQHGCGYTAFEAIENLGKALASRRN